MWLLVTSTTTRLSLSVLFLYCFCYVSLWKSGLYWCTIANRFSISEALVKIPFANGKQNSCCPLLSQIPTCLCRAVLLPVRRRRQGRRSGWLVNLKLSLAHHPTTAQGVHRLFPGVFVHRRFLDPVEACLIPVSNWDDTPLFRNPCPPRLKVRQTNLRNLWPLC